jgi:predicted secreted hydrolase
VWSSLAAALLMAATLTFQAALAPYTYHFPRDHAAHDRYRTEWWYFTGHLQTAQGRRFGFEVTFFRVGLEPRSSQWRPGASRWYAYQLYPAHLAITDEAGHRFIYAQILARDALGDGYASQRRLDVRAGSWTLTGTQALRPLIHLYSEDGGSGVDLVLHSVKPPAIHGVGGISQKGPCRTCASHYYSFTHLLTSGTLECAGARYRVTGIAWMDHEYGSDELSAGQVGWDWFSIQLDDDREIMLYRLRERDGGTTPQSSGSFIDARGSIRHVVLSDFSIVARGSWRSPHTNAVYPSGWIVRVAGIGQFSLVPVMRDQELADPTGTSYWEGAVDVRDARTGAQLGVGYVELTGYARPVQL